MPVCATFVVVPDVDIVSAELEARLASGRWTSEPDVGPATEVAAFALSLSGKRRQAADWLAKAKREDGRKQEVGHELERLLKDSKDNGELQALARASEVWATADCIDPLVALVDHAV